MAGEDDNRSSFSEYFRRVLHYEQMDLDYTFCQMLYVCFSPNRLYQIAAWRKKAKNQWARDDPAFTVLIIVGLVIASTAYSLALTQEGIWGWLKAVFYSVGVYFLLFGIIVSTVTCRIADNHLRVDSSQFSGSSGRLEWMYCFDIHCNAFFPLFLVLWVAQYFLLPLLFMESFLAVLLSDFLYLASFSYYYYLTCKGFSALPFLKHTEVFLGPIVILIPLFIVCLLMKVNATQVFLSLHF